MKVLLDGVALMEIPIGPNNSPRYEAIIAAPVSIEGDQFPRHLADAVDGLWKDRGVRAAFERRNELQLNDSAP
jgi:guanine nucleotide-binding protein subunit alpha